MTTIATINQHRERSTELAVRKARLDEAVASGASYERQRELASLWLDVWKDVHALAMKLPTNAQF